MSIDIVIVFCLIVVAVVLFASERLPADIVALIIMALLMMSGVITPIEGLAGFSNTATVTVGAMFVLSAGLYRTGAVAAVGVILTRLGRRSFWLLLIAMMLFVGFISAFINNTAAVAIFLPILIGTARETGISRSRLLMPLSFASMFGGVCTLIGTSTNLLVSSMLEQQGMAPLGMFEFTRLGAVLFLAGTAYMVLVGVRLIPDRKGDEEMKRPVVYMTEIILLPEARSVGTLLSDSPLLRDLELKRVEVIRGGLPLQLPADRITLMAGDTLRVHCDLENFRKLQRRRGIALRSEGDRSREEAYGSERLLAEGVVARNSTLDGRTLKEARFRSRYGLTVHAIRHHGHVKSDNLDSTLLRGGDVLLIEVTRRELERLQDERVFVVVTEADVPALRKRKAAIALAVVAAVVTGAAMGVPIVAGAIAGSIIMVLGGCLTLEEAHESVDWQVIMLMAGMMTLGAAMEKTGAAALLSGFVVDSVGKWGPVPLVAALYLFSAILTAFLSNNATVALLIPIALSTAHSMGLNPLPLVMAITFAASLDFMTPFGYQTNTLVYGPGGYTFKDYLRVGAPLNLMFWALASLLIPRFWPF